MIEFIFTIDYEIYGDGGGSLRELVYEPAESLKDIFKRYGLRFLTFIEVAELEKIEVERTDRYIDLVKKQILKFYEEGFEIGLHLHPQWYNGRYENGRWLLDYGEYNLCNLSRERICQILDRAFDYLGKLLERPEFAPLSFRAGNWLLNPTTTVAKLLAERGVKIDSSLFKGGLQHQHGLDYRKALQNGYYWRFTDDTNLADSRGVLLELPIYAQMVPFWKMATAKRLSWQRRYSGGAKWNKRRLYRLRDFLRFRYPLKFDFCRMTLKELTRMLNAVIERDRQEPTTFKPLVGIGHTKDLADLATVENFLAYLAEKEIPVVTFKEVYDRCMNKLGS